MCSWLCLHSHLLVKLIVTMIMVHKYGKEGGSCKSKARKMTICLIINFTAYSFCRSQQFLDNLCFHSEWYLTRYFGAFQGCDQQIFLGSRTYSGSNIPSTVNSQKISIDNLLLSVIHTGLVDLFLRTVVIPYAPLTKKSYKCNQKLTCRTYCVVFSFFVAG